MASSTIKRLTRFVGKTTLLSVFIMLLSSSVAHGSFMTFLERSFASPMRHGEVFEPEFEMVALFVDSPLDIATLEARAKDVHARLPNFYKSMRFIFDDARGFLLDETGVRHLTRAEIALAREFLLEVEHKQNIEQQANLPISTTTIYEQILRYPLSATLLSSLLGLLLVAVSYRGITALQRKKNVTQRGCSASTH